MKRRPVGFIYTILLVILYVIFSTSTPEGYVFAEDGVCVKAGLATIVDGRPTCDCTSITEKPSNCSCIYNCGPAVE